jgi:SAM-dependent methyltransferase
MTYWRGAAEDEAMQEEHAFIWQAMLKTIDVDLAGKRVLDVGCNRGGFLRLLAERCGIAEGFGYDPAAGAIEDARRLTGRSSLHFEVGDNLPEGWSGFEVAFSHEVLYLLHDLHAHARTMYGAMAPQGVYFAVMGVHSRSPLMVEWYSNNATELGLPKLYDIDEVVAAFALAGFEASAARLAMSFVPAAGHGHHESRALPEWLEYYNEHKLILRFAR